MGDYAYKPRLGFDIRVRPPREEAEQPPAWAAAHTRLCDVEGCDHKAIVRVAKSPRNLSDKVWLCTAHAHQHNRAWNYFEGLSETEAQAARLANIYGDRPTWEMGKNDRARASAKARGPADMRDAFGVFAEAGVRAANQGPTRNGRAVPKLQVQAFETLGLRVTAAGPEIRRRYAELVRRYHPDANGGDRSTETQLAGVKPGQHADISIDALPDVTFAAQVESIGAGTGSEFSLIPAQNATGNWVKVVQRLPVRMKLEGNDYTALRTGMSAVVSIDTGKTRWQEYFE